MCSWLVVAGAFWTPALAQSAAPPQMPPTVAGADDVRRVREELDRLRLEFDALRRAYDDRLQQLEQRLAQLGGGPLVVAAAVAAPVATSPPVPEPAHAGTAVPASAAEPAPAPGAPPTSAGPPAQAGVPVASSKVFNPDISVNGNFLGAAGRNPFATLSPMQLSEVEAAFQSVVDPYARADFFISVGSEGASVEEGFITFTALPANLLLKAGRLRAQFGKMNTLHTHALPSADRPLVTGHLLGEEEGYADAGFSLSYLARNPLLFLEFTGEVYAGTSELFQSDRRSKLVYLGRARGYRDLTESSNLDLGVSVMTGPTRVSIDHGNHDTGTGGAALRATGLTRTLVGVDATFRYRPLRRAIYQRLNLRTEFIWSRQQMPATAEERAFGLYASAEYQFARRWYIGARADRSGRAFDADAIDTGGSVFLTFWPTEFSQVRGQYRRLSFAEGVRGHEFLMQFNFSIGAHSAHIF